MALSIKTKEADHLARSLAGLMGESMTEAVTIALRERLSRERAFREADGALPARLASFAQRLSASYDRHPVSRAEWDEACGEAS